MPPRATRVAATAKGFHRATTGRRRRPAAGFRYVASDKGATCVALPLPLFEMFVARSDALLGGKPVEVLLGEMSR